MAAFEKIKSGIPEMDEAFHHIRLGDNVVWQVSDLSEFRLFMEPMVEQAIKDGRNLIYVRFAAHEPLLTPREGLKIVPIHLSHLFENFTVEIHNLIEKEGFDAFYVFDCLSELQIAWATDLMMGNFFHLTCPFLFQLDTVAYFPVIRGKHSYEAINKIRETTQLFLDVHSVRDSVFVTPVKVWKRQSQTMFMPHIYFPKEGTFEPAKEGMWLSRYYQQLEKEELLSEDQNADSWERFFREAQAGMQAGADMQHFCSRMSDIMLTKDPHLRVLVKKYMAPRDFFRIRKRMIGTGMIGGKACGMLLARKIVEVDDPELFSHVEPHDSYYIGSDVFYAYIVDNHFWDLKLRQRTDEGYFSLAKDMQRNFLEGKFSEAIREQFLRMLDYYGPNPIIVRSSSLLEDGFGNAFAGKYESVFCANQGTEEERLLEFEKAVKYVYASTMGLSALDYRLRRGLNKRDEQMALLVQRVSGSHYEGFFMPDAAGVGYSISPYSVSAKADDRAGMLRLVMGLGTAAVDRKQGSYPRLVMLDKPKENISVNDEDRHRYSQRMVDIINTEEGVFESRDPERLRAFLPRYLQNALFSHDRDAEYRLRERGMRREVLFISCQGLVAREELMESMRKLLKLVEAVYENPVDVEFTVNQDRNGDFLINILQCRPLTIGTEHGSVEIPEEPDREVLLESVGTSMGFSRMIRPDLILYVDPVAYYTMPYAEKREIAAILGRVNWLFRDKGKDLILFTPGRICTSSPELGVPSTFADISGFRAIFEVSESRAGYMPELSYGSHIFQDLVEAEILYSAVFETGTTRTFAPEIIKKCPNRIADFIPAAEKYAEIIGLYEVTEKPCELYFDMQTKHLKIYL